MTKDEPRMTNDEKGGVARARSSFARRGEANA